MEDLGGQRRLVQLLEASDRMPAQDSCVARDADLASLGHAGKTPIQRGDQLFEVARKFGGAHRHGCRPVLDVPRRDAFQTSPHAPHRQYACSSGLRAVVEITADRQDGQHVGPATPSPGDDARDGALSNSYRAIEPHSCTARGPTSKQDVENPARRCDGIDVANHFDEAGGLGRAGSSGKDLQCITVECDGTRSGDLAIGSSSGACDMLAGSF